EPAHTERQQGAEGPTSVLWQRGGLTLLPYGTYHLLRALSYGYLLRKPAAAARWLAALVAHCERPEQLATWQALSRDPLRYLHQCEPSAATRFLARLFENFPGLLDGEHGAVLLTHVWAFVPADSLWGWLQRLRRGTWEKGAQAYGELLAL